MFEVFVFGTFWFWALVAAEVVALYVFTECENGIGATLSLVVFGALLQFAGHIDILGYVVANPFLILGAAAAFFLLGLAYATFRWIIFVMDLREKYNDFKARFLKENYITGDVVPEHLRAVWKERLERYSGSPSLDKVPQIRDNKGRWMRWAALWPFSLTIYLCKDFISGIVRRIYRAMEATLQRMADSIWSKANIEEDLKVPPRVQDDADDPNTIR